MTRRIERLGWLGLLLMICGCGWLGGEPADSGSDDAIPELGERSQTGNSSKSATPELPAENLELRLQVGTRFPLFKTVEQRLRQMSPSGGQPIESWSRLTMKLAVTVEAIDQGVKTLGVRYQQVRYEHDIAGEKVTYDSALLPQSIPEAAWGYHGLVDNGFSFDLGADNRIVEIHDFESFLQRCVRHAPIHQQEALLTRLAATQEDEGIANFVDDSVGMLPYNIDDLEDANTVKVGTSWRKTREIMRPIPMTIETAYRLGEINDRYATLELFGQIAPARIQHVSSSVPHAGASEKMTLRSGHSFGTCTIDRQSGLPIQSHVTRRMDLTLELPTGAKFEQVKETVTTIRTYPEQGAPAAAIRQATPVRAPALKKTDSPAAADDAPISAAGQRPSPPGRLATRGKSPRNDDPPVFPAGFQVPK